MAISNFMIFYICVEVLFISQALNLYTISPHIRLAQIFSPE